MKKISIILMAAMAMVSCGNTYTAKVVSLGDNVDSLNYALGYANGAQMKMYQLRNDSDEQTVTEFIDALDRGFNGKVEELEETAQVGMNIGQAIKASEKKGLADNAAWQLNEKILFQGLTNAVLMDTTMMQVDEARMFFQSAYQTSQAAEGEKAAKAKTAKCGTKAKTIELKSHADSLNYAFGVLNGNDIRMYVLANDSDGSEFKELVKYINKGLKSNVKNPQIVQMGENIGKAIKEQEEAGLIGVEGLETRFELIKQGFVNGLKNFDEIMTLEDASKYLDSEIARIKFGDTKAEGEKFLEENKLREGVITTESGLQYEVLKMGKGAKPAATDKVTVHYHGTLIDGTVFDSSVNRGEPATFGLNQVIKGWTEGVQLMPVGSKFKFYIPQELGYGAQNAGSIPPYSTLIFEVELLSID